MISGIQQNGDIFEMTMQHAFCTTLEVTNRNAKFHVWDIILWTMIPHVHYYFKIGNPGHELMNNNWIRKFSVK